MNFDIKVAVADSVKEKYRFDIEKDIREALQVVPLQHLTKLSKIIVQYEPPQHNANAMGSYFGNREGAREPYILLCAKNLMSCFPHHLPIVSKLAYILYLRDTLYHEIGHHHQRLTHGVKKERWEENAKAYSRHMQRLKYKQSFVGKIIFGMADFFRSKAAT